MIKLLRGCPSHCRKTIVTICHCINHNRVNTRLQWNSGANSPSNCGQDVYVFSELWNGAAVHMSLQRGYNGKAPR